MGNRAYPDPVFFVARPWGRNRGGTPTEKWNPGPVVVVESGPDKPDLRILGQLAHDWPYQWQPKAFNLQRLASPYEMAALLREPAPAAVSMFFHKKAFDLDVEFSRSLFAERQALFPRLRDIETLDGVRETWKRAATLCREIAQDQPWFPWRGPRRRARALVIMSVKRPKRAPGDRPGDTRRGPIAKLRRIMNGMFGAGKVAWTDAEGAGRKLSLIDVVQADIRGPILAVGKKAEQRAREIGIDCATLTATVGYDEDELRFALRRLTRIPANIEFQGIGGP